MTALYSILHLLVDGVCAMAMFGTFIPRDGGYFNILLYNFCAFALQMPFGVAMDALHAREEGRNRDVSLWYAKAGKKNVDFDLLTAVIGVLCTIAGAVTHPVVLGIGNALFHVGGGVGTIRDSRVGTVHEGGDESDCRSRYGGNDGRGLIVRLGVFVAPGALGLYLGTLLVKNGGWSPWIWGVSAGMLLLCVGMMHFCYRRQRHMQHVPRPCDEAASGIGESEKGICAAGQDHALTMVTGEDLHLWFGQRTMRLAACCLIVVILRSYLGMAVAFPWKTGVLAGVFSVLAVVGGKMMGGFLSAWKGSFRTAAVSLVLAAVCYFFSSVMPLGLAALFLFNMTMPITLYWMIRAFPQMPGFAFGSLTFALFLGFLPAYMGVQSVWAGNVIGGAGSMLSLLLLAAGIGKQHRHGKETVSVPLNLPTAGNGKGGRSERISS